MHSRAHCTLLTAVRIHRYASSLTLSLRFKSVIHSPSMPPGGTAPTNKSNIPECVVRKVCWIIKWTYQMFSLWLTGIKVTGYWWAERGRDGGSGLGRLGNGEFFYRTIKSPPNKRLVSILKYLKFKAHMISIFKTSNNHIVFVWSAKRGYLSPLCSAFTCKLNLDSINNEVFWRGN